MATKRGLNKGKGLSALIDTNDSGKKDETKDGTVMMNMSKLSPNKSQPRKNFDEDALNELADSIKQFGVLEPLVVRKKDNYYEIVAGERRWRASTIAGIKEIPVVIKDLTDLEALEIGLIENTQREDLNPIEEATTYKRLMDEFNLTHDEVAEKVSKSRTTITNSIRLLKLTKNTQDMLIDGQISMGHARALLGVEDPETQYSLAQRVFDEKLSVRDIEKIVKNLGKEKKEKKKVSEQLSTIYNDIADNLKNKLGTKVAVSGKDDGKGKIEIEFYSHEDLDRIVELIGK